VREIDDRHLSSVEEHHLESTPSSRSASVEAVPFLSKKTDLHVANFTAQFTWGVILLSDTTIVCHLFVCRLRNISKRRLNKVKIIQVHTRYCGKVNE
jgi:hypothetical protein